MKAETLLAAHAPWLRRRAPEVRYSARILYQELCAERGYRGSYETVKRFVAPLRELAASEQVTQRRFETGPGQQSQIDWGQARVLFRHGAAKLRLFVLTLGFSRRGFYWACPDERLSQFLEAHERAFAHFGGVSAEHLYDRPRTVCHPSREGKVVWNSTFKAFAEHLYDRPRTVGRVVAEHGLRSATHELAINPEHGPGALARNARSRYANAIHAGAGARAR